MHLVWQVEPAHALGHFRLQLGSEDLVPLALGHHHPRTLARVRFGVRAGVRVRIRVRVRVRISFLGFNPIPTPYRNVTRRRWPRACAGSTCQTRCPTLTLTLTLTLP